MILFMIGDEWHGSCIRSDVRVSPPHPRLDCVTAVSSDHPRPGADRMRDGPRPRACAVPTAVARARGLAPPRETARPSREPEPRSRGWERGGRGRAALAARGGAGTQHHKGMAGMGATRGGTPPRRGRLNYHGHASNMHHTLCYPLGSFPVIAILAVLCCALALSWHIQHQKPWRKLQASSQS